jgi:hypothetical protein
MEELVLLLRWALVVIGFVYLLTESGFFMPLRLLVRKLGRLATTFIYCPACTGFWIGGVLGYLGWWPWVDWPTQLLQSAVAATAVATTWSKLTGGNPMYSLEADLG